MARGAGERTGNEVERARQRLPVDQAVRERIRTDLDTNLLVEAGAGSGKTTELVNRMVALVASGRARVDEIAAITFTRKAAAELGERFHDKIEEALAQAQRHGHAEEAGSLDRALREIDRAFIGTIHAFCARLLRERPLDAGVEPGFAELSAPDAKLLEARFWHQYSERLAHENAPILAELDAVGLEITDLASAFESVHEYPDVAFTAAEAPAPDCAIVRGELEQLISRVDAAHPDHEPARDPDDLRSLIRVLQHSRELSGWHEPRTFFEALDKVIHGKRKGSQKGRGTRRERSTVPAALSEDFECFAAAGGPAHQALLEWYAHRYPIVLRFLQAAADAYREERIRTGRLVFQDLLVLAARMLRESPDARRDLAERYRVLLVDEFQDTDPIQAEVIMLLSSADPQAPDWWSVRPRPGSLFVVGDPKQSIYRFRRADIDIYNRVRQRFREFGDVVELVANFRSQKPIAELVNRVFPAAFPPEPTPQQARFAPLHVETDPSPQLGVFWYRLDMGRRRSLANVAEMDARCLAAWIRSRLAAKERSAGDFLILTYRKDQLETYARALEAFEIPVQVTGAGVLIDVELRELLLLLRCLADPGNQVLTVAVLLGLFFGLDYAQLATHAAAGRSLRFDWLRSSPEGDVEQALAKLHEWWEWSRQYAADVSIAKIVDETGLLPWVAARELGGLRAGSLAHFLELARQAGLRGETTLPATLDFLEAALADEDVEAPLEPGRTGVVRVMNLHKAKGLEAKVVILAHPVGKPDQSPTARIERPPDGEARGWLLLERKERKRWIPLARPLDWAEHAAEEMGYRDAEWARLVYVAVTRAGEELVIARATTTDDKSPWQMLYPYLEAHSPRLDLVPGPPPPRHTLDVGTATVRGRVAEVERQREALGRPSYRIVAARAAAETHVALLQEEQETPEAAGFADSALTPAGRGGDQLSLFARTSPPGVRRSADGGLAWGRVVHAALAEAGRGAGGAYLRRLGRDLLLGERRPTNARGEPLELERLIKVVDSVLGSELGARLRAAERAHYELEFMTAPAPEDGPLPTVLHGAMDVIFREAGSWVIVDYKTDADGAAGIDAARLRDYRSQLDTYARAWRALTGETVKERILWFTADARALLLT